MAIDAFGRLRPFQIQNLVAPHALLVVGALYSRSERISFIKGFAVAATAPGRFVGYRAVVMAALANGARIPVKISGQPVILDGDQQRIDNFSMGHFDRFIFLG